MFLSHKEKYFMDNRKADAKEGIKRFNENDLPPLEEIDKLVTNLT